MEFHQILKHKRKALGYTLKEIADRVGVTEATVQRWESGNIKTLRQGRISKLADILEISPAALMGWSEEDLSGRSSSFVSALSSLSPETRTVYNYEGEGTHTINIKPETIDKLRKLLQVAGDLPPEKIDSLINVAENMK